MTPYGANIILKHDKRLRRNPSARCSQGIQSSQFAKVKKGSSDLQNRPTSFEKVSEKGTRKRKEVWKNYLSQKVAAPNLFSLTKQ